MTQLGKVLKAALAVTLTGGAILLGANSFATSPTSKPAPAAKPAVRTVELSVTAEGFVPASVKVKKGEPLKLVITRKTDDTCATELLIQDTKINVPLPLNKAVEVSYTPEKSGQIKYGCAMGMMISGVLLVE